MCVCVCACVRACVRACVHVCGQIFSDRVPSIHGPGHIGINICAYRAGARLHMHGIRCPRKNPIFAPLVSNMKLFIRSIKLNINLIVVAVNSDKPCLRFA